MEEVGQLLGSIVHRLNSPLGAIRAIVALTKLKKADLLEQDEFLAESLEDIESLAAQALSLVSELRRPLQEQEDVKPIPVRSSLEEALSEISIPASIEVALDIGSQIPDVMATSKITEVFRNIALNAIEAMPDGGCLHIEARADQKAGMVEVLFRDTGLGIPSYMHSSLFRPYFTTKDEKGHGLGLWWSRTYLEMLSGSVELLESKVGEGSIFKVTLPAASEQ